MTSRDFCYWLQGYFELTQPQEISEAHAKVIQNHLSLVFIHELDDADPTGVKQAVHDGTKKPSVLNEDSAKLLKDLQCKVDAVDSKADKALKSAHDAKKGPTIYRC